MHDASLTIASIPQCSPTTKHQLLNSINKSSDVNSPTTIYHVICNCTFPCWYGDNIGHVMVPMDEPLSRIFCVSCLFGEQNSIVSLLIFCAYCPRGKGMLRGILPQLGAFYMVFCRGRGILHQWRSVMGYQHPEWTATPKVVRCLMPR